MSSNPQAERFVMCPVCHQANPAGAKFCQHCWGASLHADSATITSEDMERLQARMKLRRYLKPLVISLAAFIVVAAVVFATLSYYTDVFARPNQALTSSSRLGDWTMFHRDISHSGAYSAGAASAVLPQGTLKWSFPTDRAIASSPAIVDGVVYFGSRDGRFYAVDAATGSKIWDFQTGSWVDSSPSVAGGIVYFGSNDGNFYALDAKTGKKLWTFPTRYPITAAPAIAGGIVYFGSDDYNIYALNAKTGKKLWNYDTGAPVKSSPVVNNGILFSGSGGEYFYALDAMTGRLRLLFKSIYPVYSAPVAKGDMVSFTTSNGLVYIINGTARRWLWEHEIRPIWIQLKAFGLPIPRPPLQSGLVMKASFGGVAAMSGLPQTGEHAGHGPSQTREDLTVVSSPALAGDSLYVGVDNRLTEFSLSMGHAHWEMETGELIESSPALAGDTLYVGSDDGHLYAVDTKTGQKLWDFATKGMVTSSPAVVDGVVYFGSYDGNLYALK